MHEIVLQGCTPEPLTGYLKALAVLRLVSEQADPEARGRWDGDRFVLHSTLDGSGLTDFFVNRYRPTPLVAPWNGGSGFYPKDNRDAMNAILSSENERLSDYRTVIQAVFALPELPKSPETVIDVMAFVRKQAGANDDTNDCRKAKGLQQDLDIHDAHVQSVLGPGYESLTLDEFAERTRALKADRVLASWSRTFGKAVSFLSSNQRSGDKNILLASCRNRLPESVLPWIDAAFALTDSAEPTYAAILGSGGNEGRLDYTLNFMQHIVALLLGEPALSGSLLAGALMGESLAALPKASIGQFQPGRAGGFNQGPGFEHKNVPINPWDFVLSMEGAVTLASSVVRRQGAFSTNATSPFTVSISRVGFASSADQDVGRAESWQPLWDRPARYAELAYLFREGRATVGGRAARNGTDMARAIATFGVDRGIASFVRFGFLKRRGDSYVALPMGRIPVRHMASVMLLDDIDPLVGRIAGLARAKNAPARLESAHRLLEEALFQVALRGNTDSFQQVIIALGRVQQWSAQVAGSAAGRDRLSSPLRPALSPKWLSVLDDGSPEFRLAAALASIGPYGDVGSFAANLMPLDPKRSWTWVNGTGQRAWRGPSVAARLASVLERRMTDGASNRLPGVPLVSKRLASPMDVAAFLRGLTDDARLEALLWGLTLVRWDRVAPATFGQSLVPQQPLSRAWCLLKLLFLPRGILGVDVSPEPRVVPMLARGDPLHALAALGLARHRLLVEGLAPKDFDPWVDFDPVRMAAALLVPVARVSWWKRRVLKPDDAVSIVV